MMKKPLTALATPGLLVEVISCFPVFRRLNKPMICPPFQENAICSTCILERPGVVGWNTGSRFRTRTAVKMVCQTTSLPNRLNCEVEKFDDTARAERTSLNRVRLENRRASSSRREFPAVVSLRSWTRTGHEGHF